MEPAGSTSGADRPAAAEDEALKRNTDCVYFLASPLTCKKGSECEYRHSEGARVNPRDCWYWLNGNCLNPKCSFRHPPLDGLYGPPGTTSGSAPPLSQAVSSMQIPATHARAYNLNKQSVPCYYFQKGVCLKGDMCPFMHGPQTTSSSVPQEVAKVPVSLTEQSQTLKKDSWGLKKCTVQQPKAIVEKPPEVLPPSAEPAVMADALSNNVMLHQKSLSLYQLESSRPKSQIVHVPLRSNDAPTVLNNHLPHVPHSSNDVPTVVNNHQVRPVEEHHHSDHEANEFLLESSPGFDVLVDDDRGEGPDYFHNENVNSVTDFEYKHAEYEPFLQFERNRCTEMSEYERDERVRSRRGREQNRRSSERVLNGRSMGARRALEREETVNEIDGSDLRHRLLKQRRFNDSRSSVKHDHHREPYQGVDRYAEERNRDRNSSRTQHRYPQERSISTRLQGRLALPRRSSRDNPIEFQSRKERDRERHRRRSSPTPPISNHQGRQHERVRRRESEEFTTDVRNSDRQPINRDDTELLDFAGPKSLAELKGAKTAERSQEQSIEEQRSMKPMKAMSHHESEESLLFEGPKPLSVILKRKRETELGTGAPPSFGDENQKKERADTADSVSAAASSMCLTQDKNEEEEEEEEGLFHAGDEELHNDGHFCAKEESEVEDDTIMETTEDHDLEEHRDEESDYELMTEGGEFRTEDDNVHRHEEEDFADDDDDHDFARKIGMILS